MAFSLWTLTLHLLQGATTKGKNLPLPKQPLNFERNSLSQGYYNATTANSILC